ncbi:metal-dependent hydrolase family protein [Agrobacterium tumefaciens]|uniref:metal-dependent hydrolase family protein n=1 Tax=Agrobacterium tumefaciens TaxID=358 RepID=UPI0015738DFA|nr:amidohydrolase family protein [Agrobacterium tumefaciens]NTA19153.1 amidohydrolase family protein [Agrobacterium tumefaciens]WCK74655.1 amidohydrolase family protein [Agrobacterium tumefaciens]
MHAATAGLFEVSSSPSLPEGTITVDCQGKTLTPGLIDAHVHVIANSVDLSAAKFFPSFVFTQARYIMEGMLQRGFTTVRDGGGADAGLVQAVEQELIAGPRLVISGLSLSQTGGHGDMRSVLLAPGETTANKVGSSIARIADGISQVREAARDELRKGAHFIKIMASGGAASVTDPIENLQYSGEELEAIVEEARAWNTYVMAHAYTPRAIAAVVKAGGRTIEHGNLIDELTANLMREAGAYLVPTLVASDILTQFADKYGFSSNSMRKIAQVRDQGLKGLSIARKSGVKIGFGTDLLGIELHDYQGEEFALRAKVEDPVDTLISATSVNAEMMMMEGRIGVIRKNAVADILVVEGDPTVDATVFTHRGENIDLIMKGGKILKNRL